VDSPTKRLKTICDQRVVELKNEELERELSASLFSARAGYVLAKRKIATAEDNHRIVKKRMYY